MIEGSSCAIGASGQRIGAVWPLHEVTVTSYGGGERVRRKAHAELPIGSFDRRCGLRSGRETHYSRFPWHAVLPVSVKLLPATGTNFQQ